MTSAVRTFIDPFDAWQQPLRPLDSDNGSYDPASAEIDVNEPDDVTDSEADLLQRAVDDQYGDTWGHEPGARRYIA